MFENFKKYQGLLGINARNLLYVKPHNKKEAIKLADSKLKTKSFLSARGIPTPRLFAVIRNHEELQNFDFGALPGDMVLKPNRGLGGEGIIVFKSRKGKIFKTVGNKKIKISDIQNHIADILDGRFSINSSPDIAFFEQRIINHPALDKYSYKGLPDIRIIVHNLVPVMAMLRLPTIESEGKANLALGALAVGIDLSTGKPTYLARKYKLVKEIPNVGKFDKDFRIPHFDEMLLIASKSQIITNLGYLACDIALDETNGPILLEVNARAGLKVQLANKAPLKKRLIQVSDIKVTTPEKGVRVAKDLFGSRENNPKNQSCSNKKVIGIEEIAELSLNNEQIKIKAKIDINSENTYLDKKYQTKIKGINKQKAKIKFILGGQKHQTIVSFKKLQNEFDMYIGKRDLKHYLIDTNKKDTINAIKKSKLPSATKKIKPKLNFIYTPQVNLGQVDHKISLIANQIKLVKKLTPINLENELKLYKKDKKYNPQFIYETDPELVYKLLKELENIKTDNSDLGKLFEDKRIELITQVRLLELIGTPEFTTIAKKLYPHPKKQELLEAEKHTKHYKRCKYEEGKKYNTKETIKFFETYIKQYGLKDWKIEVKSNMISRCSVNKKNRIFIKKDTIFHERTLKKLVAHEIETHVLTAENGKKQPYLIFQQGTANYLETQEGLAIYNQEKALKISPHNYFDSTIFIATNIILKNSFVDSVEILTKDLNQTLQRAIQVCIKVKRGLGDTSQSGGIAKQALYYRGAKMIDKFVKEGGNLKDLYIGKITLHQLKRIKKMRFINPPSILPNWYK